MIETERLRVRRVRAEDWRDIRDVWADAAAKWYARYDRPSDPEDEAVRRRIEKWASFAESREHMFFAVCLGARVIGYVAANRVGDGCEIGYCFHSDSHGQGYARESISAVLAHLAGEGVGKFTAGTALANTPSVRLLQALGFIMTGTEKVSFYRDAAGNDIVFEGGLFERPVTAAGNPG